MCNALWRFLIDQEAIAEMWQLVIRLWKLCVNQSCNWWCLCCNVWLCIFLAIFITLLAVTFTIMFEVWVFVLAVACETLCVVMTILSSGGPNAPNFMCFDFSKHPPPPPPPPPPPASPLQLFAGGPYHGMVGQQVPMAAIVMNAPAGATPAVSWDFGDSHSGQGMSVSHVYGAVGIYHVTASIAGPPALSASTTASIDLVAGGSSPGPGDGSPG